MSLSGCPGVVHEGVCVCCDTSNACDDVSVRGELEGVNDDDSDGRTNSEGRFSLRSHHNHPPSFQTDRGAFRSPSSLPREQRHPLPGHGEHGTGVGDGLHGILDYDREHLADIENDPTATYFGITALKDAAIS
jgi:hypothetical protein